MHEILVIIIIRRGFNLNFQAPLYQSRDKRYRLYRNIALSRIPRADRRVFRGAF